METNEIASFAIHSEPIYPFGLVRAEQCDLFAAISRQAVLIVELNYTHHFEQDLNYNFSLVEQPSKYVPAKCLEKSASTIFENATQEERLSLMIDPYLLPTELRVSESTIVFTSVRWSPPTKSNRKHLLLCLTNFGGCEIIDENRRAQKWDVIVANVANVWVKHCRINTAKIVKFDDLDAATKKIRLTAVSWNLLTGDDRLQFVTISESGVCAFFEFRVESGETKVQFECELSLISVNALEWFSFYDEKYQQISFLIAGDEDGNVFLFRIQMNDVNEVIGVSTRVPLFEECDDVRINSIQCEYYSQTDCLLICFAKGMHLFVYSMNTNAILLDKHIHYVGHFAISGVCRRNEGEYFVTSITGHVECVHIKLNKIGLINLTLTPVQIPYSYERHSINGFAVTKNNAFELMTTFANVPYDHLVLRKPASLIFCQQMNDDCLKRLQSIEPGKLYQAKDLAELTRCLILRGENGIADTSLNTSDLIICSNEYLHLLKIQLITTMAKCSSLRHRKDTKGAEQEIERYNLIRKIILAIKSTWTLSHLNYIERTSSLNAFQITSAQSFRHFLNEFSKNYDFGIEFNRIRTELCPSIDILLSETERFDKMQTMQCICCDESIQVGNLNCVNDHKLSRCCISMVQVPFDRQRYCSGCRTVALDDLEQLKTIVNNDSEIRCPFCDSELQTVEPYVFT